MRAKLVLFLLLLPALQAMAQVAPAREDMAWLRQQAETWLVAQLNAQSPAQTAPEVRAGNIDERTQLSKCQQPIRFDFAPGQGLRSKTTLSVRCPDAPGWRLFLPMTLSRREYVWVAKRTIFPDSPLQMAQWQRELRDVASLPCTAIAGDNLSVYQARITIAPGAVLCENLVSAKTVMARGQRLTLLANHGNIAIRVAAEALDNGSVGQRIRVKNLTTGRLVDALVVNSEEAQVVLPDTP